MACIRAPLAVGLIALVAACGPTFNWRDVSIGSTALTALFPCKPETITRTMPIAGANREISMRSCDTGGATFAVGNLRLPDPALAPQVQQQWRDTTLAGLRADPASVSTNVAPGLRRLPQALALRASREPGAERTTTVHGLWFVQSTDVFAAFVMGPGADPEVIDTFFAGMRLR